MKKSLKETKDYLAPYIKLKGITQDTLVEYCEIRHDYSSGEGHTQFDVYIDIKSAFLEHFPVDHGLRIKAHLRKNGFHYREDEGLYRRYSNFKCTLLP